MFVAISRVISFLASLLVLVVIVNTILSYFLSPDHPLRVALDKIIEPLLRPIRRVVHPVGGFDFSPLVLIVIIEILSFILTTLFLSL